MPCYQIPIVKLQSLMPLVPCLCRLTVHDARLPKAGATFRSLPVFSCFLGLIVLLCRQAKDCGVKTPGGPPALTAKWSWQFGSRVTLEGLGTWFHILGGSSPVRQSMWLTLVAGFKAHTLLFSLPFTAHLHSVPSITPVLPTWS